MADGNELRPVIIKKKKVVGGGGHHGGAWKVAYADFVTAMMAFFMLMWLLNAPTEKQRKGIADYFSPTIPIARVSGGGDGAFGGDSVFSDETLARNGTGATSQRETDADQARGARGSGNNGGEGALDQALANVEEALVALGGESDLHKEALKHIITRVTDEGLVIELFDLPNQPLFVGAEPQPILEPLASIVASLGETVENSVSIGSHVPAQPLVVSANIVWDISSERAAVVRAVLSDEGFDSARIARTIGHADREPVVGNLMAPRNNRIELIFLREGF